MNILEMPKSELLTILEQVLQDFKDYKQRSPFICSNINRKSEQYYCESGDLLEIVDHFNLNHLLDLPEEEAVQLRIHRFISRSFWAPTNKVARINFLEVLISRIKDNE